MKPNRVPTYGDVSIKAVGRLDAPRLQYLLETDRAWLEPWEATLPGLRQSVDARWLVSALKTQMRQGSGIGFTIRYKNLLVGQLNVANIIHGSVSSATIGYWIASNFAGKGITTVAVALAIDYLFDDAGLHRVEIDIRPENKASLRVVEKLGIRNEGLKERFIYIDGAWRDHLIFGITSEERSGSMLDRLR